MEKDIEIIKSLIEDLKREEKLIGYDAEVEIQALENLIKRCKELEEENRGLRLDRRNLSNCIEAIKHTTPLNMVSNTDYYIQINDNYIPKSKVKEKIEKLEEREQELSDEEGYWGSSDLLAQIEVLQELMEDK